MAHPQEVPDSNPAGQLVDVAAAAQAKKGRQSIEAYAQGVKAAVRKQLSALRETVGTWAEQFERKVDSETERYVGEKKELLGADAAIDDISGREGASGLTDKIEQTVTYDDEAMRYLSPEGKEYYEGVRLHEHCHLHEQAKTFNREALRFEEREWKVNPVLVEGHATQGQKTAHLTPEYAEHQAVVGRLIRVAGDREFRDAMKSGDIAALQARVDATERDTARS